MSVTFMRSSGTFVNINATQSIPFETRSTGTRVSSLCIDTEGMLVATVTISVALVNVRTRDTITIPPIFTSAGKSTDFILTVCMVMTIVSMIGAFVNIFTRKSVA
jgi:hypothetical protein